MRFPAPVPKLTEPTPVPEPLLDVLDGLAPELVVLAAASTKGFSSLEILAFERSKSNARILVGPCMTKLNDKSFELIGSPVIHEQIQGLVVLVASPEFNLHVVPTFVSLD